MAGNEARGREKPGPPKGCAYGIAAVTQVLKGLAFPVSKEALLAHVGPACHIAYRKGQPVDLTRLLRDSPRERFASTAEVVAAVRRALAEERLDTPA